MEKESTGHANLQKEPIHLPLKEAYDQWATTYDTDGNFLQALDTLMMAELLPRLVELLPPRPRIIDLGCGTGRNTHRLLTIPGARIKGLDISLNMIDKAKELCNQVWESLPQESRADGVWFKRCDVYSDEDMASLLEPEGATAIISTLFMEHVPLTKFFEACYKLMQPGGLLLITNMHSDMGAISQAGFVYPKTKNKIRTVSHAHTIDEVLDEAKVWDFKVLRQPDIRAVREDDVIKIGERASKWVGVNVWFSMILQKEGTRLC